MWGSFGMHIDLPKQENSEVTMASLICLQGINLTNSTTGDLVFMVRKKFCPIYAEYSRWNTLMDLDVEAQYISDL